MSVYNNLSSVYISNSKKNKVYLHDGKCMPWCKTLQPCHQLFCKPNAILFSSQEKNTFNENETLSLEAVGFDDSDGCILKECVMMMENPQPNNSVETKTVLHKKYIFQLTCPVCFEIKTSLEFVSLMPCGHAVCFPCLSNWVTAAYTYNVAPFHNNAPNNNNNVNDNETLIDKLNTKCCYCRQPFSFLFRLDCRTEMSNTISIPLDYLLTSNICRGIIVDTLHVDPIGGIFSFSSSSSPPSSSSTLSSSSSSSSYSQLLWTVYLSGSGYLVFMEDLPPRSVFNKFKINV
jgi:Zinc finger, C3HC4 type (RING finger)